VKLVGEVGSEELLGQVDATDDLNGLALVTFTASGSFSLDDC
jgi:hypothetical protein